MRFTLFERKFNLLYPEFNLQSANLHLAFFMIIISILNDKI
jgi:hypothetical protein